MSEGTAETEEALHMIAESLELLSEREENIRWNGHYGLYKQLTQNGELLAADAEISGFYEEKANGNMGRLHRAIELFQPLRKLQTVGGEAVNAEQVLTGLNNLMPDNSTEHTLTQVLRVLYANVTDLPGMNTEHEALLREIAQRCPLDDGFGVYIARASLLKLDSFPQNYMSECERVPAPAFEKIGKENAENSADFTIYPNPNNGYMTLNYNLNEFENGVVEVFDLVGKQVFSQPLTGENSSADLFLSGFDSGIYLLRVMVNGDSRFTEKLSVIKE